MYTCGSSLFPHENYGIVVREVLVCASQYYSAALVHFPSVCYHCGLREESLIENDEIKELKKMYALVYPLCFVCLSDGKKAIL